MARVHVLTGDLLFGSNLQAQLDGAGYVVSLGPVVDPAAELIVADLTAEPSERIARLRGARQPVLAYYSHVETHVREEAAGLTLVVPRSRMAREAPDLVARLLATAR